MITYDEVLNLNYYKKTSYSGWMEGMRFLIKRETPEESDPIFHVWIWPGPFIFSLVPDKEKIDATFPFSDEGKRTAVDWINEQFAAHMDLWSKGKLDNFDTRG